MSDSGQHADPPEAAEVFVHSSLTSVSDKLISPMEIVVMIAAFPILENDRTAKALLRALIE